MPHRFLSLIAVVIFASLTGCYHQECCPLSKGPSLDFPSPYAPKETTPLAKSTLPVENKGEEKQKDKEVGTKREEKKAVTPGIIPEEHFFTDSKSETKKVAIQLVLEAQAKGWIGAAHPIQCLITNPGDRNVESYQLRVTLPEDLTYEDGTPGLVKTYDLTNLKPQAKQSQEVKVIANKEGQYTIKGEILHLGEAVHTKTISIAFEQKAEIALTLDGPLQVNQESQFEYTITVENKGRVALVGITVQHQLERGLIYITSTPEGSYKNDKSRITWKIGDLLPAEQKTLKVKVTAIQRGEVYSEARAKDEKDLVFSHSKIKTEVVGSVGLQIQHYDTTDPVEVGETTIYVIELLNQGWKEANNVEVVDTIPPETSFVTATVEGMSNINFTVNGQKIQFDVIRALVPKEKVTFRVSVKAEKVGDLLNTIEVRSDEFVKSIVKQEGTKAFKK